MKIASSTRTRLLIVPLLAIPCLFCIGLALRWSIADHLARRPDLASAHRAAQLVPAQARYRLREAALLQRTSFGDHKADAAIEALLSEAAQLAPLLADPWMQAGLFYETHDRPQEAEQMLLRAAEVDHTFKPAWTLANFYVRQGNHERFWPYARRCLELAAPAAYSPEPVFDLCWRVSEDSHSILSRAVPDSAWVKTEYVAYLVRQKKPQAAVEAWHTLPARPGSSTVAALDLCDLLLRSGDVGAAMEVWNRTNPQEPLSPETGKSLTNGALAHEPTSRGFDWRLESPQGTTLQYFSDNHELRAKFDGDENESSELFTQFIPVAPRARYRLHYRYRTADVPPGSGLRWRPVHLAPNAPPAACDSLSSEQEAEGQCEFQAGDGEHLMRLSLEYTRALGTRRLRGDVQLSQIRLEKIS